MQCIGTLHGTVKLGPERLSCSLQFDDANLLPPTCLLYLTYTPSLTSKPVITKVRNGGLGRIKLLTVASLTGCFVAEGENY